jgi:quaternary ammonium compound-resistance protein SugE
MAWFVLAIAGMCEVVWASLLDATKGFTRPLPTAGFVLALALSMWLLATATRSIPIGTAYAVWVGIGAVGAFVVGVVVQRQPTTPAQVVAMAALMLSLVAVKATAAP